ncbi:methyltransferase domain-containing protein [Actinomadura sp. WMMB 499]|uniref:methyltransferase domain-containing protein n=1 Tax=Actinomadura sp. WMMB 499 TaxID=1219491 RepID=UPI0012448F21|nr:methyltransferase domain-containing protein [Actinomadura sp. WMMB 499]QFG21879.1 protein-L-isoaspartate(D-aspartate) O-methyltransferase [Actinomadura sp. WMMB 499]
MGKDVEDLIRILTGQGDLKRPEWARAFASVPRELFVPDRAWVNPDYDAPSYSIDRHARPGEWRSAVYSDASIVTQVDDGAGDPASGRGWFTSSVSAPGVVVQSGELLAPAPGDRVLEVGTGSGWTACLLSRIVGEHGRVVSVEVDPGLAASAEARIEGLGVTNVQVLNLDALDFGSDDLFDRLHVTAGVSTIPWSLLSALRPGGTAVLPWCPSWGHGHKVALTRIGDEAVGRLSTSAGYMMLRSQRPEPGALGSFLHHEDEAARYFTEINPKAVGRPDDAPGWAAYGGGVVITALAPGIRYDLCEAADGSGEATLWLRETYPGSRERGSWATVEYVPDAREYEVTAYGERDLWDEVSGAWMHWNRLGRPERDRFGVTVSRAGRTVWLDGPEKVVAPATRGG